MHVIIGMITYGKNKDIARKIAINIAEAMIGEGNLPFDYGDVSSETISLENDAGMEVVNLCMESTVADFIYNMQNVRRHLASFTDEELATNEYLACKDAISSGMARYWMYKAGQYKGDSIYLYDNDGEGIRTKENLQKVLSQWDKPVQGQKVFVTTYNMHF